MILYFSGTGNSAYVANKMAEKLEEEVTDISFAVRKGEKLNLFSKKPWILVVPTYAWRIPKVVEKCLREGELKGNREIYFVMTCGDSNGAGSRYCEAFCRKNHLHFRGCTAVHMPENYIVLFQAPDKEEALHILKKAEQEIDQLVFALKNKEDFPLPQITWKQRWQSGVTNPIFYTFIVKDKKFYSKENCIYCGKCVEVCPLNNISLEGGKPKWKGNCTHCMACICSCPVEAIEYAKKTFGKKRYLCPNQR